MSLSIQWLVQLLVCALPYAGSCGPIPAPIAKVSPGREQSAFRTFVTTATESGSTFRLTYAPAAVSHETTITEASTAYIAKAGGIIGALTGAAGVDLPFFVSKVVSADVEIRDDGNGGGGEDRCYLYN